MNNKGQRNSKNLQLFHNAGVIKRPTPKYAFNTKPNNKMFVYSTSPLFLSKSRALQNSSKKNSFVQRVKTFPNEMSCSWRESSVPTIFVSRCCLICPIVPIPFYRHRLDAKRSGPRSRDSSPRIKFEIQLEIHPTAKLITLPSGQYHMYEMRYK